jgi:hypothetical protein
MAPPRPLREYPAPEFGRRALGKKAAANRALNRVWLDPQWFPALKAPADRLTLIAHEYGHLDGALCEGCADTRAGELLKLWGLDGERAANLLLQVLEHRDPVAAHDNLLAGYHGDAHADAPSDPRACACVRRGADQAADALAVEFPRPGTRLWWALVKAGGVAPFRANYDPDAWRKATGSLPTLPPVVVDARGRVVSGPAHAMPRSADAPTFDPSDVSAELYAKAYRGAAQQAFQTTVSGADAFADILADTAVQYFPDDARRYAWIMLGLVHAEANPVREGQPGSGYDSGSIAWNYTDGTSSSNARGAGPTPGKVVASTDYGLGQINDKAHPDLTGQTFTDPTQPGVQFPAWGDARKNLGMVGQVLAACRAALPGDVRAQVNAYHYGISGVQQGKAQGGAAVSRGALVPVGQDYATSVFQWLALSGVNPLDDAQWAPPAATPAQGAVAAAGRDFRDAGQALAALASGEPVDHRRARNLVWVGALVALVLVGVGLAAFAVAHRRKPEGAPA